MGRHLEIIIRAGQRLATQNLLAGLYQQFADVTLVLANRNVQALGQASETRRLPAGNLLVMAQLEATGEAVQALADVHRQAARTVIGIGAALT